MIEVKWEKKHFRNLERYLERIPVEAQKTTARAVERKAKEMVSLMKSIVPVDKGVMKRSIHYRIFARGMKAVVYAGIRAGGAVARHVEFGTKRRGFADAQPFFTPVVQVMRDKINASIRRSLKAAVKKAGGFARG